MSKLKSNPAAGLLATFFALADERMMRDFNNILDGKEPSPLVASEDVLSKDWETPEEDDAWKDL